MTGITLFNASWSPGLNELLTAAVVNQAFARLLLQDAGQALKQGYNGRVLMLTPAERARVLRIRASSLSEFVVQLVETDGLQQLPSHGRGGGSPTGLLPCAQDVRD